MERRREGITVAMVNNKGGTEEEIAAAIHKRLQG